MAHLHLFKQFSKPFHGFKISCTVAQFSVLSSHSKKVLGSILGQGVSAGRQRVLPALVCLLYSSWTGEIFLCLF